MEIVQVPAFQDNYLYLLHDPDSGVTAVVDPGDAAPIQKALSERGWQLDYILNTHHHPDHVAGNLALKDTYRATIIGPAADKDRIPGIDVALSEGETFDIGNYTAAVIDVPGHTKGHIAWYFESVSALFCGDTLFAMGCGRLFEGTPEQMLASLDKIAALPDNTRIYCAHEYTMANADFAITVDPDNVALGARIRTVAALRERRQPTVPSLLGLEKQTNPFLRSSSRALADGVGLPGADRLEIFTKTRELKDNF